MQTRSFLLLLLLILITGVLYAQGSSAAVIDIGSEYEVSYPEVRLNVGVSSSDGSPIQDLTAEDFEITLNGESVDVLSVERLPLEDQSLSIVLVVDTSDSMGEVSGIPTNLEIVSEAVNLFLDNLLPSDEVAIITFGSTVALRQTFTSDFEQAKESISILEPSGRTALYDASFAGVFASTSAINQQRFVVLLTDGWEYGGLSSNEPEAAIRLARQNDITVYTIGLGAVDREYLSTLATETDGQFFERGRASQLVELYENLVSFLRNRYVVTLDARDVAVGNYSASVSIPRFNTGESSFSFAVTADAFQVPSDGEWEAVYRTQDEYELVFVPSGCLMMGSDEGDADETPVHEQCIDEPFFLDRYEISNSQFGSNGYFSGQDRPRDSVTWNDAVAFCDARGGRLPTEAEWEYAARGPRGLIYPWGNLFSDERVAYSGNTNSETQRIGERNSGASWTGAEDMSGNVWEWTSSIYQPYPYDANDGREDSDPTALRVLRGGSANNFLTSISTTNRFRRIPDSAYTLIGFRCAFDYPLD